MSTKKPVVGGKQLHSTNHFCHCHQPKMSIIPKYAENEELVIKHYNLYLHVRQIKISNRQK